jgi:predicted DNA-binding protein (UPF0251 family)
MSSVFDFAGTIRISAPKVPPKASRKKPAEDEPAYGNPWGLSPNEAEAIEHFIEFGSFKNASRMTGITRKAYEARVRSARKRMGTPPYDGVRYVVLWDRWRQANKEQA